MTQSYLIVIVFLLALCAMPWLVKWAQRRYGGLPRQVDGGSRIVSTLALGPQQRVVTVEVGPAGARQWLVLGVTNHSIQGLHVFNVSPDPTPLSGPAEALPKVDPA